MDLISSLPDELLCHVLSFLKTKEAALTSVLAKRWRNLFALVPNIHLQEYSAFLHPEMGKRLQSFMDFGDRVLALQGDAHIKKLTLIVEEGVNLDCVNRWIRNVLQRGVSDLFLVIILRDEYQLPPEIFFSRTLVKLTILQGYHDWHVLGISLPMLKELSLRYVRFCVDQLEMLLHACPSLETFDIWYIKWKNSNLTVSSASLKKLIIKSAGCSQRLYLKSLSFDTPNLAYIDYSDYVSEDYPKVNFKNLVKARINLTLIREPNIDGLENDVFLQFGNVRKFFNGIKNVQNLYLCNTLEVLSLCCESMPVFNNLKILHIYSIENQGWRAMPILLKNCPHLETLVFYDAYNCISQEIKGRSLITCPVKTLQLTGFRGTINEIEMIKHFLDYFPCLKKMEIYPSLNGPANVEVPESLEHMMKKCCDVKFMDKKSSAARW